MSEMAVPARGAPRRRLRVVVVVHSESETGIVSKEIIIVIFVVVTVTVVDVRVLFEEDVVLEVVQVVQGVEFQVGTLAQLVDLKWHADMLEKSSFPRCLREGIGNIAAASKI